MQANPSENTDARTPLDKREVWAISEKEKKTDTHRGRTHLSGGKCTMIPPFVLGEVDEAADWA